MKPQGKTETETWKKENHHCLGVAEFLDFFSKKQSHLSEAAFVAKT